MRAFLSSVTDPVASQNKKPDPLRTWLADELRFSGTHAVYQEFFIEVGVNTLVKLAVAIEKESDLVLHIIGDDPGTVPPSDVVQELLRHCDEPRFRQRFPNLFATDLYLRLTYTQWEAWLAIFYQKAVLLCRDQRLPATTVPPAASDPSRPPPLPMAEHRQLLKAHLGYAIEFATQDELKDQIHKALLRKLQTGTFAESQPSNLRHGSLGKLFIGRDGFLDKIRDKFLAAKQNGRYPNHLIHGPGGVGKTRAAMEYAHRFHEEYLAVLFVSGEKRSDLERTLAELAGVLKLNLPPDAALPVQVQAVRDWLRAHPGWLLIIDNVDEATARDAVLELLVDLHDGHLLVTGRFMVWPADIEPLELTVLHPDDATRFLLDATAGKREAQPTDEATAREIAVNDLGRLCLALEQASAYIAYRQISFAEYRERWKKNEKQVRTWADNVLMRYHQEKPVAISIANTWQTSVDQLTPAARSLLEQFSWLAPDPIPRTLFAKQEQLAAPADLELPLAELRSLSLLQRAADAPFETIGQVHRLVQLITREQLPDPLPSLQPMLAAVDAAATGEPQDVRTWPIWEPLQPHVAALIQFADAAGQGAAVTRLMNNLGLFLATRCAFAEAESLYRRALALDQQSYGAEHPEVAIDLNNLAQLLQDTNRLAEAEPLMRRALDIDEQSYGAEHPKVAIRLNNLALLLQATNRLAEAELLIRRALAIDEQSSGAEHPNVAIDLNNLATLLQATNRLAEAEPLMARVVTIFEKSLGTNHPNVATALNNLAQLLQATNRLLEAEPLMRRALAIDEQSYGADHPAVARDLNNLARLLQDKWRELHARDEEGEERHGLEAHATLLAEAEPLMRRAVEILRKSLGDEHPDTITVRKNYAALLRDME